MRNTYIGYFKLTKFIMLVTMPLIVTMCRSVYNVLLQVSRSIYGICPRFKVTPRHCHAFGLLALGYRDSELHRALG